MQDESQHHSRWILRVMEWNDPKARYPNIWYDGMPSQVSASARVARRLSLGDLIAVYYPATQRHTTRAERYLGLSRVSGLRTSRQSGQAWVDLEIEHRFEPPLDLGRAPRRVFLCCDPGWPDIEVELFRGIFDAARDAGWKPLDADLEPTSGSTVVPAVAEAPAAAAPIAPGEAAPPSEAPASFVAPAVVGGAGSRLFAGVDYGGDMRDPRRETWLAIVELCNDRLRLTRLEATGRHGLEGYLRDPDRALMNVEAIGLDFPFGLPQPFAESLLGGAFPEDGWWGLARRLERLTRPQYLTALQEFREVQGELKRITDERAGAFSPLHRDRPDLGPTAFHGIRMIAEDRSRYAVRPFETAQGRLLLEVFPEGALRKHVEADDPGSGKTEAILTSLRGASYLPIDLDEAHLKACHGCRDALDAVVAARCASIAVLTGEADRSCEDLASGEGERVRREGWIYGLEEPA